VQLLQAVEHEARPGEVGGLVRVKVRVRARVRVRVKG